MESTTDELFFVDTKQQSVDDLVDIDVPLTRQDSDGEEHHVVLGEDAEEIELERLVFGANPDKLFEDDQEGRGLQKDIASGIDLDRSDSEIEVLIWDFVD